MNSNKVKKIYLPGQSVRLKMEYSMMHERCFKFSNFKRSI